MRVLVGWAYAHPTKISARYFVYKAVDTAEIIRYHILVRGAIAQLGERLHGMQEVVGSSPSGSTSIFREDP